MSQDKAMQYIYRGWMGPKVTLGIFSLIIHLVSYLVDLFCSTEEVRKQPEALLQLKLVRVLTKVTSKASRCSLHILNTL
jgi:hypothetical protein